MFLKEKDSGELVEVLSLRDLTDPFHKTLIGRYNAGEELPDPKKFSVLRRFMWIPESSPPGWRSGRSWS